MLWPANGKGQSVIGIWSSFMLNSSKVSSRHFRQNNSLQENYENQLEENDWSCDIEKIYCS